jgi:glycine/D-amino acid oxidase-like deaminating enzyme
MSRSETDVAIVDAGILGLAHAYMAAKAGKSVVVIEKSPRAAGASARNFGMIWPIGQPAGVMPSHSGSSIVVRSRLVCCVPWRENDRQNGG